MNFNNVPKLCESLYPWDEFPRVDTQNIHDYLTAVSGGVHGFTTFGDFEETPSEMVGKLNFGGLDFLKGLNFKVSYDTERSRSEANLGIFDTLGCYCTETRTITLFIRLIAEHAVHLVHIPGSPCAPCVMTLITLVFLHELGHAIHHARKLEKLEREAEVARQFNAKMAKKEDPIFDGPFLDELSERELFHDLGGREIAETVAQHFMMTCIQAHGVRAEWIAVQLENRQPLVYRAWRKCGFPTTWDGCRELLERYSKI